MGICKICGGKTGTTKGGKHRVFCSRECDSTHRRQIMLGNTFRAGIKPTNTFTQGHKPWNKDLKGIHLSPSTEFRPGPRPDKRDPIGTVRVRVRHKRGEAPRAWIKVADPNVWRLRAVVVWELANGPLPKGMVVHHKDRNPMNDAPENLQAMTRSEHMDEHRTEHLAAKAAKKGPQ